MWFLNVYFAPLSQEEYEVLRWVCLFVCLSARKLETTRPNITNFYACCLRPWLGPLTTLWLCGVMYFRFCGWRHVFT